jgi:hypothetical protein
MRDPQRLVDDKTHPELRQLLQAAKHDGLRPPVGAKQRVQSAVFAHIHTRDDVHRSGIRSIGRTNSVPVERAEPIVVGDRMAHKLPKHKHSWVDQVLAYVAMAAAVVTVAVAVRYAYVAYAEQSSSKAPHQNGTILVHNRFNSSEGQEDVEESESSITVIEEPGTLDDVNAKTPEPDLFSPPRELVLPLIHRATESATPHILIRSGCSDPKDWRRNVELDYPTGAFNAGISGTMDVSCNVNAEGSFSGCVAQRPPGFTAGDTGKVLRTMNTWTLTQSLAGMTPRMRRCKIEVAFDLGKRR